MMDLSSGRAVREACRTGRFTGVTSGTAPGYVQANLVAVPREYAFDFLLFCQRNPKPCPVLEVTDPGDAKPRMLAASANLQTDLPKYRVWRDGELIDEPTDVVQHWREDLVGFLLGCSFTFEAALKSAGIPVRHVEQARNVPMYRTHIPCRPAGIFAGPLVVSMRPMTPSQAIEAREICGRFPRAHGEPVHVGEPSAIGIADIGKPDFGDPVDIRDGELPVFWACGVTPQVALIEAKLPFAITHAPGHMFVSDWRDSDLVG